MASAPPRPSQPPVPKPRSGGRTQSSVTPKTDAPSYPPPPRPAEAPGSVRPTSPPPRLVLSPKRKSVGDLEVESARAPSLVVATPPFSPREPDVLPDGEYIPRQSNAEITYEEPRSIQQQVRELQQNSSPPLPGDENEGDGRGRGEEDAARHEVQLRLNSGENRSHSDSPEYEDIDAQLKRKSDYINVDDVQIDIDDSDEELEGVGFTGFSLHGSGSGYAPSIKLHSHPALRKSLSSMSDDDFSMAELIRQAKKRPKNRAPPPPPSSSSSSGIRDGASGKSEAVMSSAKKPPSGSGHRRSKSAQFLDSGSYGEAGAEILADADRRSPFDDHHPGQERFQHRGRLSPAPSPPPSAAGAQKGRKSPKPGQQSPKLGQRSPKQGQRSPKEARSKSPKQQQHRSSSEDVVDATPTPANPARPNPRLGRGLDNPPLAAAAISSGPATKKPKVVIPSRPPPPPGSSQHAKPGPPPHGPSNPPAPHHHHLGHPPPPPPSSNKSQGPSPAMESVRGHQPAASSDSHAGLQARRRSAALPGNTDVVPRVQRSESAADQSPSVKPKRHAPPPPAGAVPRQSPHGSPMQARTVSKETPPPPNYAEVMRLDRSRDVGGVRGGGGGASRGIVATGGSGAGEGGGVAREGGVNSEVGRESVAPAPPKPRKTARAQSIDLTSSSQRQATPTPPLSPSYDPYEEVLRTMDLLTIELRRGEDVGYDNLGMELVSGKVRSGLGVLADGVFVRRIRRGSPAEQDGRIQAGDMLVDVSGCIIRNRLDSALSLLGQSLHSIRVKVGRPDITASIFSVQNGVEEPIYTNQLVGTTYDDLLEKLERARVRADENERAKEIALQELEAYRLENEREKESALQELEAYRLEVQNEREALAQELEETKKLFVEHKHESGTRAAELTQTVASLSVSKTKSDSELECHREKLRELQDQLEQEKSKAEQDLLDIRQKLMETQDKLSKKDGELSNKNSESEQKVQELHDEIAKHKEDRTKMWTELVAEKERVTDLEERLKNAQADLAMEREVNTTMQKSLEEKSVEISQLQSEITGLRAELAETRSLATSKVSSEEADVLLNKRASDISPNPGRRREPSPPLAPPTEAAASGHDADALLSEEDIPIQENGEVPSDDDSDKEDAFAKHSPSPQVPCPYIDFVPLQMDSKEGSPAAKSEGESRKRKGKDKHEGIADKAGDDGGRKDEEEEKEAELGKPEEDERLKETPKEEVGDEEEGVVMVDDGGGAKGEEDSGCDVAGEERDKEDEEKAEEDKRDEEEGASTQDTTDFSPAELDKDETETEAREEMAGEEDEGREGEVPATDSSGVELVPEELVEGDGEGKEEESDRETSLDLSEVIKPHKMLDNSAVIQRSRISTVFKRKLPSRELLRKKDSRGDILHNMPESMLSDLETPLEEATPEPEMPEKSVDESTAKSSTPQPKPRPRAAPRKKPVSTPSDQSKEVKKPPQAAPRRQPSQDIVGDSSPPMPSETDLAREGKEEAESAASLQSKKEEQAPPIPSRSQPHVGPKPSPKRAHMPTPVPRPRTGSTDDAVSSPEHKDPSKLSVKEKALLAQRVLNAPDKPKPGGPPILRKPRPTVPTPSESTSDSAQPVNESTGESLQRGGASTVANDAVNARASPVPKRKLPPGAFSIMGGVSVFGPPSTADRGRSGSSTDRSRGESNELASHSQEVSPAHGITEEVEQMLSDRDAKNSPEKQAKLLSKPSREEEVDSDAGSANTSPSIEPKFKKESDGLSVEKSEATDGGEGGEVDLDVVLTWTPDVTAAWLNQVGLGSYQQLFLEKDIQGYMLFDMDGHKLKGMGVASHDDRNLFKKEIKNLKPFADKQKKLMEKQRKEEKKQAKKKKK